MSTTVTSKGQITIPKHIRDAAGVKPGMRLAFDVNEQGRIFLRPETPEECIVETREQRLERALAALGPVDYKWEGGTDSYMAFLRGED
jgi:AbrB family looped-hinge helix DNA binding protein